MKIKEHIQQKLDTLNERQLREVDNFINLLEYKSNLLNQEHYNPNKIADLYQEFAEEDRLLAEEGCAEYAELLAKEVICRVGNAF